MCERDVFYSCGACGYALNLNSSQRVVSSLNSKALRKGTISFLCIDESKFKQVDEFRCAPHVDVDGSLRLHQLRTKLLCGNCGNVIGHGHRSSESRPSSGQQVDGVGACSDSRKPRHRKYCVKIKALQPSLNLVPAEG